MNREMRDSDAYIIESIGKEWVATHPAKALRALLTDECPNPECEGGITTRADNSVAEGSWSGVCRDCGGRGWLPKDAMRVTVTEYLMDHGLGSYPIDVVIALADGVVRALLADWLGAEDE